MWQPTNAAIFGDFYEHVKVYNYYDGPKSYSLMHNGRRFYVHWCDEEPEYSMYFVREATDAEFQQLEENKITLRDFLQTGEPLYIVREWHKKDTEIDAFIIEAGDYINYFPLQGVYLTWENENEFSSEDG